MQNIKLAIYETYGILINFNSLSVFSFKIWRDEIVEHAVLNPLNSTHVYF